MSAALGHLGSVYRDGNRIRQVNPDGTSTLFLAGGLYEITLDSAGQQTGVKRYYAIAGQTVALRDGGGTFYLLTDHLGSVATVLDVSGAVVGEQRYRPFGQPRLAPGITQTDRGFTGQQGLSTAGLQDFNARWFDTSLGMFASPDSLISNPFDPQGLSRYAYVFSNPLRYADPSGHRPCEYDLDSCQPPPAPPALRGTTVHGGQTLSGGGMGSQVVTTAYKILNEDRQSTPVEVAANPPIICGEHCFYDPYAEEFGFQHQSLTIPDPYDRPHDEPAPGSWLNPEVDPSQSVGAFAIQGVDFISGIASPFAYANYRDWYVATQPANVHVYLDYTRSEYGFSVPSAEVVNSSAATIGVSSVYVQYRMTEVLLPFGQLVGPGEGLWLDLRHTYSTPGIASSYFAPSFETATVTFGLVTDYNLPDVRFVVEGR